jgi:hypothetical protein
MVGPWDCAKDERSPGTVASGEGQILQEVWHALEAGKSTSLQRMRPVHIQDGSSLPMDQ